MFLGWRRRRSGRRLGMLVSHFPHMTREMGHLGRPIELQKISPQRALRVPEEDKSPTSHKVREKWGTRLPVDSPTKISPQRAQRITKQIKIPTSRKVREKWGTRRSMWGTRRSMWGTRN